MSSYNHVIDSQEPQALADFIPELWSKEVIEAYKRNLVLCTLIPGNDGVDRISPGPVRGAGEATKRAICSRAVGEPSR